MGSISGRVLIAGTASLLLCLFLSPKFIGFLRRREFGQNIREEGPEGHKIKAGTPTMGGIIIMVAFAVPFLILSTRDWRSIGVLGATVACALLGFADDYTKIVKRRSLGLRARTKLGVTIAISVGLWWIATQKAGVSETISLRFVDATVDLGPLYLVLIYLVVAGTTSAVSTGSPPGAPRSSCWPTSGSRSSPSARRIWRCWRPAWSAPASAFCGSTAFRPACSWATPARSGSAGRSPAWP
jgi:UDP-N-acetylmuramyl pentapeptide phosphotransferase/UDP-N-acetylglucosamine-1-phosphate transferase